MRQTEHVHNFILPHCSHSHLGGHPRSLLTTSLPKLTIIGCGRTLDARLILGETDTNEPLFFFPLTLTLFGLLFSRSMWAQGYTIRQSVAIFFLSSNDDHGGIYTLEGLSGGIAPMR